MATPPRSASCWPAPARSSWRRRGQSLWRRHRTTRKPQQPGSLASRPLAVAPLELIALGHERDGDGLTVRGVVRNPRPDPTVDQLTAVVMLFNRDGGLRGERARGRSDAQAPPGRRDDLRRHHFRRGGVDAIVSASARSAISCRTSMTS